MKLKTPEDYYIEKAKSLSELETEYLQARMKTRLQRRMEDKKLSLIEAMAIQLEIEDLELKEWRERVAELRKKQKE